MSKLRSQNRQQKQQKRLPKNQNIPRRLQLGRLLAEHNRMARQALNRELKQESEAKAEAKAEAEAEVGDSNSWIPNTSFTTVLSVVGIGLTIFDLYMRYRKGEAQASRVDEKSSEVKAKENTKGEAVEKSQETSSLTPSLAPSNKRSSGQSLKI